MYSLQQALWQWRRVVSLVGVAVGLWLLLTGLAGCADRVTLHGQPVRDDFLRTAAQGVAIAEQVLAAVPPALIRGHERGLIPVAVLQQYQAETVPAVQAALEAAKNALIAYAIAQTAETTGELQEALVQLQALALQASAVLKEYGGVH